MKEHELKIWTQFFHAVKSGAKTFELRIDDRDVQVGDILRLSEVDRIRNQWVFTGEKLDRRVTYVCRGKTAEDFGLKPGYAIFGIEPVARAFQRDYASVAADFAAGTRLLAGTPEKPRMPDGGAADWLRGYARRDSVRMSQYNDVECLVLCADKLDAAHELLAKARPFILRALAQGKHEQDRVDAQAWLDLEKAKQSDG